VAQARHRLGISQFDQAFSAGSGLTQREAVAIVRNSAAPAPRGAEPPHAMAWNLRLQVSHWVLAAWGSRGTGGRVTAAGGHGPGLRRQVCCPGAACGL
jgi:hypothetical protein